MNALISDLSTAATTLISEALKEVYGEGVIETVVLSEENLRQRIRLATRGNGSVETVLIVLNSDFYEKCEGLQESLQGLEKFHLYKDDNELANYLNNRFGLSLLVMGMDSSKSNVFNPFEMDKNDVEKYESKIDYLNKRIESLSLQVKDLENQLEESGIGSEPCGMIDETVIVEKDEKISLLEKEREELKVSLENLEEKRKLLISDLESVSHELQEYQLKYSTQTGLISSKDKEISILKSKIEELSKSVLKQDLSNTEINSLKESVSEFKNKCDSYKQECDFKSGVIDELNSKLSDSDSLCKELQEKLDEYEKKDLEGSLSQLEQDKVKLQTELSKVSQTNSELESTILELNKQKIEMQNRLTVLEKSTSRDTDIESIMSELSTLRSKYDSLQLSILNRLSSVSSSTDVLNIDLLRGNPVNYKNIEFVFAGSTESRKGMYKGLLSRLRKNYSDRNVIIVDVVSETSIDYVFEINLLKKSLDWFETGGSFDNCLSSTCMKNVSVLSVAGTRHINDLCFLNINWLERLQELENSGYHIVVVFGDISNAVGRVMHESFASRGDSYIYVHGNAVGTRTVITNIRGLSNAKESTICYFDFNNQMQRYVDIASKTCTCEILGMF